MRLVSAVGEGLSPPALFLYCPDLCYETLDMSRIIRLGRLELRFNWLVAIFVLLAFSGLVRLGFWQLSRAQEKIEMHESFESLSRQDATDITNVPIAGLEFDAIQHQNRRVRMRGEFLNQRNIFLIYRTFEEQLGFEVVTPFLVDGPEMVVMVSRGWSGINNTRELAAKLPDVIGAQEIEGQIFVPTEAQASRTNELENASWPLTIRYLNTDELEPLFDADVFPYVVRLAEGEPGLLIRHWPEVLVDTSRNYSYALQWFAMAIALLIVSLILSSNLMALMRETRRSS